MLRELEPEVMDDEQEASLYDSMDHSAVNRIFVEQLLSAGFAGDDVVDLGTGTARIPIELCRSHRNCRIMASDAATSMLEIARYNIAAAGFEHRIQLHHGDSKALGFEDCMFDLVMSNSLLHHLANPELAISEIVRIARLGGRIFVRDLARPHSPAQVDSLVDTYTEGQCASAKQLFRQSLFAALTLDEIRQQVAALNFDPNSVQLTSDRHWTWSATKSSDNR